MFLSLDNLLNKLSPLYEATVAAYGISSRLLQFPEFILMGLCEGVVPLIAFSFTANKLRMKQTIGFTIKTIVALAIVFGVIVSSPSVICLVF